MSSDSEDDCYGNVAQQLQKLKNQYQEDKIESVQLLNDSYELDDIVKNNPIPAGKKRKSANKPNKEPAPASVSSIPDVIPDVVVQNNSKRTTRSSTRNNTSYNELPPVEDLPPTRRRNVALNISTGSASSSTASRGRRGRGGRARARGRGRQRIWAPATPRGRHRDARSARDNNDTDIPTYSVGNTEDYPDQSDNQVLFSNKATTADVVIIDDDNNPEENEELNVKVYWTSSEYYKFSIRRFQKIAQIFDHFAQKENICHDKLLFRLNGKILKPNDTPDSIGYTISKIIDGGIVEQGVSDLITGTDKVTSDGITLKFQCQTLKKPFEIVIKPDDKFSLTMVKVAEYLERPLEKLKFEFDGDSISGEIILKFKNST